MSAAFALVVVFRLVWVVLRVQEGCDYAKEALPSRLQRFIGFVVALYGFVMVVYPKSYTLPVLTLTMQQNVYVGILEAYIRGERHKDYSVLLHRIRKIGLKAIIEGCEHDLSLLRKLKDIL